MNLNFNLIAKFAALAVLTTIGFFTLIAGGNAGEAAVVSSESLSAEQVSLYRQHCSKCHGNDGRANTKEGRRTEATDLTDESVKAMATDKMTRIIKNGKAEMPGFGKKLSASKIAGLVQYVRGL